VNSADGVLTHFDETAHSFAALKPGRCKWCSSPFRSICRAGLCGHCYRIRLEKLRLTEDVRRRLKGKPGATWSNLDLGLRCDCWIAGEMEETARADGGSLEFSRTSDESGMTIEWILGYLSRQLVGEDLYDDSASTLASLFSPAQRAALIHLLSEAVDQHRARNHRRHVRASASWRLVEKAREMPEWLKKNL